MGLGATGVGLSGDIRLSMVKDLFGLIQVTAVSGVLVKVGEVGCGAIAATFAAGFMSTCGFGGAKNILLMFVKAASSFSKISLSLLSSLKRFLRLSKLPLTNMSNAAGCKAQYAPFPGLSGCRGILIKQSLKDRLCLNEFCHLCVFLR